MTRHVSNNSRNVGDLFDRSHLDARRRALQNGTPKWLPVGEQRAAYAMLSYNISNTSGGVAYYDKYFQPVNSSITMQSSTQTGMEGNTQYASNGDIQVYTGLFQGVSPTQSQASSTATSNYINSTNAAGEFGNSVMDVFSNSTIVSTYNRSSNHMANKHTLNRAFVDSDHKDTALVYVQLGQTLRAVSRIHGDYSYNLQGTKHIVLSDLSSSSYGVMSYNSQRNELVAVVNTGASGACKVVTWKNVRFDQYPSPAVALSRADVVKEVKTIASFPSWAVNNTESQHHLKPVLCDNGDIYVTVMFTSNNFSLYKLTKGATGEYTVSLVGTKNLTTSYGAENSIYYGQRKMQSRDGGAVLCFCPYYYYGAGISTWIINKRKSIHVNSSWMQSTDTSAGTIPVPYGDGGFAAYYCGNAYGGNYSGGYITGACDRDGDDNIVQVGSAMYLPYFTLPNTTNYPGFTQVVDYSMLDNQNLV